MNWKKWQTIVALVIGIGIISGAGWEFWTCKADKIEVEQVASSLYIYKLEDHRRYIQQRIWDLQMRYPQTYQNMREYRELIAELQKIDMQIGAYYRQGGR